MDINTCFETTKNYHTIAYYSHLVPVFITLLLSIFILLKTNRSFLAKIFFFFSFSFCLWLLGDILIWTSNRYNLINFVWAPLDYVNILFYLLGTYFFVVMIRGRDLSLWQKTAMFFLSFPGWYITFKNQSIVAFNQPTCEALNNSFLTNYKLALEVSLVAFIIGYGIYKFRKGDHAARRKIAFVGSALILFFGVFSITDYISSVSGNYEISLYGLFVLPLFLAFIIYSVIDLHIFELHIFGVQLLVYTLMILVGSQFFFLKDSTDKIVTTITFVLSLLFSVLMIRSTKREISARVKIESLAESLQRTNHSLNEANEKLKSLDNLKTEFLSLASHQLRSPLTSIKGYASMLDEGSYGELGELQVGAVQRIYSSAQGLVSIVEDLLNVSKIEQGGMKYEFMPTDIQKIVVALVDEMRIPAQNKKLELRLVVPAHDSFLVSADPLKIKQVFLNLVDNSIKYTPEGFVEVGLMRREDRKVVFYVKDSGRGVTAETKKTLFQKFSRGEAGKLNTGGSGLGLYLAQQIVAAHKGIIEIDSEGEGKGAIFSVILPGIGAQRIVE